MRRSRMRVWRDRAASGPTHHAVQHHLREETEYLKDIGCGKKEWIGKGQGRASYRKCVSS
jgi:hypothetical protein